MTDPSQQAAPTAAGPVTSVRSTRTSQPVNSRVDDALVPTEWRYLYGELLQRDAGSLIRHAMMLPQGVPDEDEWLISFEMFLGAEKGSMRSSPSRRTPRTCASDAAVGPWFLYFGNWTSDELQDLDRTLEGASSRLASEPYRSQYFLNDWISLLYFLAWSMPSKVDYVVHQIAFQNGMPVRNYPHIDVDAYRLWEAGRSELPNGRYYCYLSGDIRSCSRSAILAIAELNRPTQGSSGDSVSAETLRIVRNQLADICPDDWEAIELWRIRATLVFKEHFPNQLNDFRSISSAPNWDIQPVYLGPTPGEEYLEHERNDIELANREKVRREHCEILEFLDTLLWLSAPQ